MQRGDWVLFTNGRHHGVGTLAQVIDLSDDSDDVEVRVGEHHVCWQEEGNLVRVPVAELRRVLAIP